MAKAFDPAQPRDRAGRWTRGYDAAAESKAGRSAMARVIESKSDVLRAMRVPGLGPVSFLWGAEGRGPKFKGGYGVAHIIAKRNAEGYDGEAVARMVPVVIARGQLTRLWGPEGNRRAEIDHGAYRVTLSEGDKAPGLWLLTGFIRDR